MPELAGYSNGSLVRCHNRLRDRKPHAGSPDKVALIFSAIEFIENHSLLEIVDAWATVSHAGCHVIAGKFCGDNDRLFPSGILESVVNLGVFVQKWPKIQHFS